MADMPKLAIVTGANRGMGFETCRQLGRRGYKVILAARDRNAGMEAAKKLQSESLDVEPVQLDLTRTDQIAEVVMKARRHWGPVHVLVNNAGIYLEQNASDVGKLISIFDSAHGFDSNDPKYKRPRSSYIRARYHPDHA